MADKTNYFELFVEMTQVSAKAVEKLESLLTQFDPNTLQDQLNELHHIESEGDQRRHTLLEKVAKDFITPIEREDILTLANVIDDVTDSIEDVLIKIYMYDIKKIEPAALSFVKIVHECCSVLCDVMLEFGNFKKSKTIKDSIIEINRLEETGDRLYIETVHAMYAQKGDAQHIGAWTRVYDTLERCCDACEHAADVVRNVIMKNT